jgi:hypothetical protein
MTRSARAALILTLAFAAAGCGSRVNAPQPATFDQETADDVAIQSVTNVGLLAAEVSALIGSTPMLPQHGTREAEMYVARNPARVAWDTTFTNNGVTWEASRTFYDALDNPLPGWSPIAARMRWTSRAWGTYTGPRDTASVGHAAILDVRGIDGIQDTLPFDGTSNDTLQCSFRSYDGTRTRWFFWTGSATVENVRLLRSTPGQPPHAGTVTFAVSADRLRSNNRVDVEAHFDAVVIVTFNGTTEAEILVNGSWDYRWNLITGAITRA